MTGNLASELRRASEDERGGMMFSGLMSFIGLAILTVFTINIASEAIERERMQHAADAAAYATAVCMARGMNATASVTHQMGEKAAYAIIAEAFTGPEPEYSACYEEKDMNDFLKDLKDESYIENGEEGRVEKQVDKFCQDEGAVGGGACYDARMNLKYLETKAITFQAMCYYLKAAGEALGDAKDAVQTAKIIDKMESIVSGTSPYNIGEAVSKMQETIGDVSKRAQGVVQDLEGKLEEASEKINLCQGKLGEIFANSAANLRDAAAKIDGLKLVANNPELQEELDEILESYRYPEITKLAETFRTYAGQLESSASMASTEVSLDPSFDVNGASSRINSAGGGGKSARSAAQREWNEAKRIWNEAVKRDPTTGLLGIVSRITPYVGAQKARSIQTTIDSVDRDMGTISVLFNGTYHEKDILGNSLPDKLRGDFGVDDFMSTLSETFKDANKLLANVQGALDNAASMASTVSSLAGLAGRLTNVDVTIEFGALRQLEKTLSDGDLSAKSVKRKSREDVEKIAKTYPTVVGADSSNVEARAITRQINATVNELKAEYGFDEVVVAPLDGLTPGFIKNEGGVTPTLPVLVEDPPMAKDEKGNDKKGGKKNDKKDEKREYLDDSSQKKWEQEGSDSRYKNELPKIPWDGNDKEITVELIHTAAEVALLTEFAITTARAIIAACSYPNFARMAQGVAALVELAQMMVLYVEFQSGEDDWQPSEYGHRNNPSFWSYPRKVFEYKDAETLQWTRASYPIVDALNSHLRAYYKNAMPNSNFATYLQAWAYRYALSEPYFLSGLERPYSNEGGNYQAAEPCRLYVIAGSDSKNKGNEALWTDDQYRGRVVDEMFSVCAVVQKKRGIIGGSSIFQRLGASQGTTAVAQAYFYPYNGRNEKDDGTLNETDSKNHRKQPPTAWDTLAWKNEDPNKPFVCRAKDWESQPAARSSMLSWEQLIVPGKTISLPPEAQVEFSWRACLAPVTKSRMEKVVVDPRATMTMRRAALNAAGNIEVLAH